MDAVRKYDTVKSFAAFLEVSKDLVYEWTWAREFPVIQLKPRGKKLIDREKAVAWMEAHSLVGIRK